MATNIKQSSIELFDLASDGFKYNLQVLPDIIMSAALLFGILFQSAPMAVFAVAIFTTTVLHKYIAEFISELLPNVASSSEPRCTGQYPGITWNYNLQLAANSKFGSPSFQKVPSFYTTLMGFISGWIASLPTIYADELKAAPAKKAATTAGLFGLGLVLLLVMIYRISTQCEGFLATASGILIGFLLGMLGVFGAAQVSERRATNMLGLPLLRSNAADGKPIYVCEK